MIITDVWGSLVRFLKNEYPTPWEFIDWEAHANIHDLPAVDLMGLAGLGATADEGTDTFIVTVAFSPLQDENLFKVRKAAGELYEKWRVPGYTIPLYDAESTDEIGKLVVTDGSTLAPVGRAEVRPYQIVSAHLKVGRS